MKQHEWAELPEDRQNHPCKATDRALGDEAFDEGSVHGPESEVRQARQVIKNRLGEKGCKVRLMVKLTANVCAEISYYNKNEQIS